LASSAPACDLHLVNLASRLAVAFECYSFL
jgi:hypothetical protein